ncbi:hypothetical protein Godav_025937 [Gossypium davidsonii]|uniref:Uncharacterized protein n=1 Tax=Gossypium davidsonii TaxID=34287 RepID=A0A7J8TCT9_GOSDV|nr:hypothetical protein [Gossypium davidsonii]
MYGIVWALGLFRGIMMVLCLVVALSFWTIKWMLNGLRWKL